MDCRQTQDHATQRDLPTEHHMATSFEILACEETPLGPLCLRRRRTLSEPREWVTEITLNHEFLMSSLHTDSEQALATIPLNLHQGKSRRLLIGGLGLGYTAHAALNCPEVDRVDVVELLPQVISWMREGKTPLGSELSDEPRLHVLEGDVFQRLLAAPDVPPYDAILIDVDHSPEDQLGTGGSFFYQVDGLQRVTRHLQPDGVFALWSYDRSAALQESMRHVFATTEIHPVTYFNRHVHEEFTDWLYIGQCRDSQSPGDSKE